MTVALAEGFDLYVQIPVSERITDVPGAPWATNGVSANLNVNGRRSGACLQASSTNNSGDYTFIQSSFYGTGTDTAQINFAMETTSTIYSSGRYANAITLEFGSITLAFVFDIDGRISIFTNRVLTHQTSFNYTSFTWYPVSLYVDYNTFNMRLVINGETIFNEVPTGYTGGAIGVVGIGNRERVPTSGALFSQGGTRIDDLVITFDEPNIGDDVGVFTVFPNADGTLQDWTPASGADGFAMIDEPGLTSPPADYVEATAAGDVSEFEIPTFGETVFSIAGVFLISYQAKTTTAAAEARLDLAYNGVDYNGTAYTLGTDYNYYYENYEVNPATGNHWLPVELGDIEGFQLTRIA